MQHVGHSVELVLKSVCPDLVPQKGFQTKCLNVKAEALSLLEENLDSVLHGCAKGLSVSDTISPEIEANY